MINRISYFFIFLNIYLPFILITGPALPDIIITFSGIFFLFLFYYKKLSTNFFDKKIIYISFLFWIYLLFISFVAENKYLSFRDSIIFIRILIIPLAIYYWIGLKESNINKTILVIFLAILFVCIDTFYQFMQYESEFGFGKDLFGFIPSWYGRLTGPFGDELIPGAYLSKFSLLGLVYLLLNIKNKMNLYIASVIYLSFVGSVIYFTGERMAFATYLMGLLFLLFFYKNKRFIFLSSLLIILLISFLTNKYHPFYNDYKIINSTALHLGLKIEKQFKCGENKKNNCKRIINLQPEFLVVIKNFKKSAYGEIYNLGYNMFKDNKLFGTGLNNFTTLCKKDLRYKNIMKNYSCASHPHNIYLQFLIETGVFGFLFFIIYLFYIFYFILKKNYNEYYLISLSTLIIVFWPFMSTGSLLKNWNGISTFYIIGVCLAVLNLQKKIN